MIVSNYESTLALSEPTLTLKWKFHRKNSVCKIGQIQHWFGSAVIVKNPKLRGFDNISAQCNLRNLPPERFIVCEEEWHDITYSYFALSSSDLVDFFPWLKPVISVVNKPIVAVSEDLKWKNMVILVPVTHKSE